MASREGIGGRRGSSESSMSDFHVILEFHYYAPSSRSFHDVQACSRQAFASSGRSCDIRTDARACRASVFPGSVFSARASSSSHVFSAAGSSLCSTKMSRFPAQNHLTKARTIVNTTGPSKFPPFRSMLAQYFVSSPHHCHRNLSR